MNKGVIDIETGGFSLTKSAIVEIGLKVIDDKNNVIFEFETLVAPYNRPGTDELMQYSDEAIAIHGITFGEVAEHGTPPREVCAKFNGIFQRFGITHFIGHNIDAFDRPRLIHFWERFSEIPPEKHFQVTHDTMKMACEIWGGSKYSLANLCEYYGIENQNEHRAQGDNAATLEVYKNLLNER